MQYKLFGQGPFEKAEKFEKRLNEMAAKGWRVITNHGTHLVLGKEKY